MDELCPKCNKGKLVKFGMIPTTEGKKQRLRCQECGRTMYNNEEAKTNGQ